MKNFFSERRKKKEEKKQQEESQRRTQTLERLRVETAPSLRILRNIKDQPPREMRVSGIHEFHSNTTTYRIQRGYITGKIREAEVGSEFNFTLGDIGTSKEELHDIWFSAVRADVIVDAEEFGLIVTERSETVKK
jgi:hypothetical protein